MNLKTVKALIDRTQRSFPTWLARPLSGWVKVAARLDRESADAWLSGDAGLELLKPGPEDALRMWPVSRRVSKPGNGDDPSLIDPVAVHTAAEPSMLFRLN